MKVSERVYRHSPLGLQNLMVSAFGAYWHWVRFGRGWRAAVQAFQSREWNSAAEWQDWTAVRLGELLRVAAVQVPYYKETWGREAKAAAADCRLQELPLLPKEPLRQHPEAFLQMGQKPLKTLVHHTSGSSGTPIAVHWTIPEYRRALALREARSAGWAGVSFRQPRATFSGRLVVPDPHSKGPFYRLNRVEKQVYFSAFHLRPETAGAYVDALRRHRVEWLTGYAVSWYLLAAMSIEQGLVVPPLRAVVTTSEKVTPEMRAVMETAYGCPVFEEYSTVENALFASECEHHRLHVSPDAGIVEILREDGSPCDPGEAGEVVATCLLRTYQPLIRFRLGDVAAWDPEPCPCGRAMPVLKEVVGRLEDVVVGPDGRRLVRFHGIYLGLQGVRCGQVIQEAMNSITVRVEATRDYNLETEREIIRRVKERIGGEVSVVVLPVDAIPRGPGGKFRAVVSRVGKINGQST